MSNFKSLAFIAAAATLLSACSTPVKLAETHIAKNKQTQWPTTCERSDVSPEAERHLAVVNITYP